MRHSTAWTKYAMRSRISGAIINRDLFIIFAITIIITRMYNSIQKSSKTCMLSPSPQNEPELLLKLEQILRESQTPPDAHIALDCQLMTSRLKVLVYEHLCANPDPNIEALYSHINEQFFSSAQFYCSVTVQLLKTIPNMFELIVVPIVDHYFREYQMLGAGGVVANVQGVTGEALWECLCGGQLEGSDQVCYRCGQGFHAGCFGEVGVGLFECPFCFLKWCEPDKQVQNVLFLGFLPPADKQAHHLIPIDWPLTALAPHNTLQLRCTRLRSSLQQSWPPHCDIYLDDTLSVSYRPLAENSPLKRRHDTSITISAMDLAQSQWIRIHEYGAEGADWHVVGVFVVGERNEREIFEAWMVDPRHCIDEKESRLYLERLFQSNGEVAMSKMIIWGQCQFYGEKIRYPCRSRLCTSHYQPFDMYNFICSSVKAKGSVKRWRCPICGVRAYDVVRDLGMQRRFQDSRHKDLKEYCFEYQNEVVLEEEELIEEPYTRTRRRK